MNDLTIEEATRIFAEEGICKWCLGEREITNDAGTDTEWTEVCPVCHPHKDEDFTGCTNEDR